MKLATCFLACIAMLRGFVYALPVETENLIVEREPERQGMYKFAGSHKGLCDWKHWWRGVLRHPHAKLRCRHRHDHKHGGKRPNKHPTPPKKHARPHRNRHHHHQHKGDGPHKQPIQPKKHERPHRNRNPAKHKPNPSSGDTTSPPPDDGDHWWSICMNSSQSCSTGKRSLSVGDDETKNHISAYDEVTSKQPRRHGPRRNKGLWKWSKRDAGPEPAPRRGLGSFTGFCWVGGCSTG